MDLKAKLQDFMSEVWNNGDFTNLEDYVALKYKIRHDPGDPWDGKTLDHDKFIERVLYSRNAFPDLNFDLHEMNAESDEIAVRWTMTGIHQGDLPQLPATGKQFSITGMTFYYFEDGKLIGHCQSFESLYGFKGKA